MKLILSTLTAPQSVCITKKNDNGSLVIVKRIEIKGGANVADKHTMITAQGVVTELTDADFEALKNTGFYKRMEKRGYLRPVDSRDSAEDTKKAGMESKDSSAQLTEDDFPDEETKPVTKGGRRRRG